MRLALIQPDIVSGDPRANIDHMQELIARAVQDKPDIIVLPEMWNTSYALKSVADLADRYGEPAAKTIGGLAGRYGVNIVAGSVADLRGGKVYNTSYIFNRRGEVAASYSKVHLFGLMEEGNYLAAGDSRVTFELDGVRCGIIICYDLRFPELSRLLALDGAVIMFVPAQWPKPRQHPWHTLMLARAIENQMFVAGVNRVGREGKAEFFGHSLLVNPLGEIILQGSEQKEEILSTEIDLDQVKKVREYMTCFNDRVPAVYKEILNK